MQSVVLETFGDNIARAERQLAGQLINPDTQMPFDNEAAGTNSGQTLDGIYSGPVINFEQCGITDPVQGLFGGDTNFPGIDPAVWCGGSAGTANPDHFAMAATIKLSLAGGGYRMGGNSDDEVKKTEEHTAGIQAQSKLVCRLLLE